MYKSNFQFISWKLFKTLRPWRRLRARIRETLSNPQLKSLEPIGRRIFMDTAKAMDLTLICIQTKTHWRKCERLPRNKWYLKVLQLSYNRRTFMKKFFQVIKKRFTKIYKKLNRDSIPLIRIFRKSEVLNRHRIY